MGQPGRRWCLPCCEVGEKCLTGIKHTTNNHCHSSSNTELTAESQWCMCVCMSVHQKPTEKSLVSPFFPAHKGERLILGREQTANMEARSQPGPQSIMREYYQINEFTVWVLAADGRTLVGYLEPRESDLFSELICLISPAWCWKAERAAVIFQMQEISNHFIACETGLLKLNPVGLLVFLFLRIRTKGSLSFSFSLLSPSSTLSLQKILIIEEWDWLDWLLRPGPRSGSFSLRHSLC